MTPTQLEDWLATDESRSVGQDENGESTGHRSGQRIVRLLGTVDDVDERSELPRPMWSRRRGDGPHAVGVASGDRWSRTQRTSWVLDVTASLRRTCAIWLSTVRSEM